MRLFVHAVPPVGGPAQPDLSDDFGTLAATPGEAGELPQVGRLLGRDVAPLQAVHERTRGAPAQPLGRLLACVEGLLTALEARPGVMAEVRPYFLDGTYTAEDLARDLAALRHHLRGLAAAGAEGVVLAGAV
ncbi:MAG: hypothetical protein M9894_03655 [Planctomycetes bacterium]|nr:hypothetical protein [Planctomycetota bacterium]